MSWLKESFIQLVEHAMPGYQELKCLWVQPNAAGLFNPRALPQYLLINLTLKLVKNERSSYHKSPYLIKVNTK
jgi:hypothetical protein